MYILKKLNREKKVGTAAEVAVLQNKGWKVVKEPWKKPEIKEVEKTSESEPKAEDNELDAEVEPKLESDNEPGAEPEKKTSARSRKKD